MPSTATTISLAEICQYLYTVSDYKQSVFFNGTIDPRRNMQLYMERKALEYGNDQSLEGLTGATNYVYTLLGAQLQRANEILSAGSGGIVVPPSSGGGGLTPFPINVTISAGQAGVSTLQDSDWIGLQDINQVVINQSVYQSGYQFTFSSITGTFDFSLSGYILQEGDVVTSLGFMPTS